MQIVKVDIKSMEVSKFHPKEPVEFKVFFNDGQDKCLMYASDMELAVRDASAIIGKIKKHEKDKHRVDDPRDILESFINVMITDEEEMMEKIARFIGRVKDSKKSLLMNRDSMSYMQNLNKMESIKINFQK